MVERAKRSPAACGRPSSATGIGSSTRKRSAASGTRRRSSSIQAATTSARASRTRSRRPGSPAASPGRCGLNEDLVEAIGLGHDLGHTPFGHTGEEALDRQLRERFGRRFRHNEHSLRIVDVLEKDGQGLNLTAEVRDGILNHTGPNEPETLEGKIVRIVDRVAYINHDIDDALRAGVLTADELPRAEVELLGETGSRRIDALVHDLVETSHRQGDIQQSEDVGSAMLELRRFMFERVYLGPHTEPQHERARAVVARVFGHLADHPEQVPEGPGDIGQRIADYVAGMTDRFALAYSDSM